MPTPAVGEGEEVDSTLEANTGPRRTGDPAGQGLLPGTAPLGVLGPQGQEWEPWVPPFPSMLVGSDHVPASA